MRLVTLLVLALLVLGALATARSRRHVVRRQPPDHAPPRPMPPRDDSGNHRPLPNETGYSGDNNYAPSGNNNERPLPNETHPNGPNDGNTNNNPGDQGGSPPPTLEELLPVICDNITAGCEKDGLTSNHDGKVSDLCDNAFCKEFVPNNLCIFECISHCADEKGPCADQCMKCASVEPPMPPKESIPEICDDVAKSCKDQNKTAISDGTATDLCDAEHCKAFLPDHMCFFGCAYKCANSATGDEASAEACLNNCMKCQGDGPQGGHGGGDSDEGPAPIEGGDDQGGQDGDQGEERDQEVEEIAERVVRAMGHKRHSKSFTKILNEAVSQTSYRRYSRVPRKSVPIRRYAPVRRGYYYP